MRRIVKQRVCFVAFLCSAFKAYAKYFRESALQELDTMDSRERKTLGELINRESDNDSVKSGASASAGTFSKRGSFRSGKIAQSAQSANAPSAQLSLARANSQERPLAFPVAEPSGNGGSVAAPRAAAAKSASTSDYSTSLCFLSSPFTASFFPPLFAPFLS